MKIKLYSLCLGILIMQSCSKLLEEEPLSSVSVENFYKTEKEASGAVSAVYGATFHNWFTYHGEGPWILDISTDDLTTPSAAWSEFDNYTYNASHGAITEMWAKRYDAIVKANIAIEKIPDVKMDAKVKNRLLGETHFLRAFNYFDLVKLFGGVPIVTEFTYSLDQDLYPFKSPAEQVYAFIEDDLKAAENLLSATPGIPEEKGRVSLAAVKGIMARMYLYRGDYANTALKAKEVIDMGLYSLNKNYGDNFREATENGVESILEVQFEMDAERGNWMVDMLAPPNPPKEIFHLMWDYGQNKFVATEDLYNSYEAGDLRKKLNFIRTYKKEDSTVRDLGHQYIIKYRDEGGLYNVSSFNYPILRYADILLMYAEAVGPTTEGYEAINKVRRRAFGDTIDVSSTYDLSGLDATQFKEAVLKERRLELFAEGLRRFDLIRTGKLVERVTAENSNAQIASHNILLPIPQLELNRNTNLRQNDGY